MNAKKQPRPEPPSVDTLGTARAARNGINCPVCGRWKRAGALLCHECMSGLGQSVRNEMAAGIDRYVEIIRDLRCENAARDLGLKIVAD